MFKWLGSLFHTVPAFERGEDYVVSELKKDPTCGTRLWNEQDNPFDRNDFERGMKSKLLELSVESTCENY